MDKSDKDIRPLKQFAIIMRLTLMFTVICICIQLYCIKKTNETEISFVGNNNEKFSLEFETEKNANDVWETSIVENGVEKIYEGSTRACSITNNSNFDIKNWKIKLNITQDCYLNGFWCGDFEVHQFRDGKEIIDTINNGNYNLEDVKAERNHDTNELMIILKPNDYLIYIPSVSAKEDVIKAGDTVGIGFIFYYQDKIDFSNFEFTYFKHQTIYDGPFAIISLVLIILSLLLLTLYHTAIFTYKKAKKNINNKTNAIISGLGVEYETLWLIDNTNKTIELFRNRKNLDSELAFFKTNNSYYEVMENFIESCVVDEEKEGIRKAINLSTINANINEKGIYIINYTHKYKTDIGYYQMVFIKTVGYDDRECMILAYRDVTEHVKEDKIRAEKLEEALKKEEEAKEIIESYNKSLDKEIKEKTKHISEIQEKIVLGMANIVENRDNNTGGHVKRTSEIIKIITEEYGRQNPDTISEQQLVDITRAAPMHDLGKINIDSSILCKPGKLTNEEFDIMKTHSTKSGEIVKIILDGVEEEHFVNIAYNVARYHHERWDGKGYPEGLKGEQIPLEARIMSIADVYDALVSKRCYKEAMSFDKAKEIMREGMGTQFDPQMNSVFNACVHKLEEYYSNNN